MNLEQLALLAVIMFAFFALMQAFHSVRTIKRAARKPLMERIRRPIGTADSARAVARSVIDEVARKHPELVAEAARDGALPEALEDALQEARAYFMTRVEARLKAVFNEIVDERIFARTTDDSDKEE